MAHFRIALNAVRCKICTRVLISVNRHNFVACAHIFNDGGHDYIRRGGMGSADVNDPWDAMEDMTLVQNEETKNFYRLQDIEPDTWYKIGRYGHA